MYVRMYILMEKYDQLKQYSNELVHPLSKGGYLW